MSKTHQQGNGLSRMIIAEKHKELHIMPTSHEQPPLDVSEGSSEYVMRKEITIRKSILKSKLGTLVMEAAQPPPLRMGASNGSEDPPATTATIILRFDPADQISLPPQLGDVRSKLKICTYAAVTARNVFPDRKASIFDVSQAAHTEQFTLSSRCITNVQWEKHLPGQSRTSDNREYANTSCRTPRRDSGYQGTLRYTASIIVPITLPADKAFVPTFHSCLISRMYQLKFELGLQAIGYRSRMELKVPLQVLLDRSTDKEGSLRGSESVRANESDKEDVTESLELWNSSPQPIEVHLSNTRANASGDESLPSYPFGM
ncbi:hypothetical protein LTR37_007605 [Vermiconidia calcicola]|uniref:Uncharacterized protein n=1 Tax=Vermiconidia calcicola TaxID=1690605 RepID=A0ACC3NEU1_9PEZI|nr:hypothetical protein LTR37_007605 [Vermiconidia calcicola]